MPRKFDRPLKKVGLRLYEDQITELELLHPGVKHNETIRTILDWYIKLKKKQLEEKLTDAR